MPEPGSPSHTGPHDLREPIDGRERPAWGWIALGLAAATCTTMLLEVVITRIFSVILVYHFAFMAISLALFGLGLAGVFVYLYPERFARRRLSSVTSVLALLFGLSIVGSLFAVNGVVEGSTEWPLRFGSTLSIFLVMAVPFFFSGLTVAVPISRCTERIGSLYAADLAGAALGAALAIPLLGRFGGPMTVGLCGLMACASALCFAAAASSRQRLALGAAGSAACIGLLALAGSQGVLELRHSRRGLDESLVFQRWNSFSRVSVSGPFAEDFYWRKGRGAPERSSADGPTQLRILIDGGAGTPLARFDGDLATVDYLRYDVTSLVYQLRHPRRALILGTGGGRDVLTARVLGVDEIQAVEINPLMAEISREQFRDFSGSPYDLPGVDLELMDGRHFAARSTETYDVVQLSAVDTWAASGAGAMALVEHSLYTLEAFEDYYDRLADDGLLSVTHRWGVENPIRALRVVDLVRRAWASRGTPDVRAHVIVIGRKVGWGTMLASKRPFTPAEVAEVERVCERLGFGLLYAPGRADAFEPVRALAGPGAEDFLASYPENVAASTDDWPFFFFEEKPGEFLRGALAGLFSTPKRGEAKPPRLLARLFVWMAALNALLVFALPMALGRLRLSATRGAGRSLFYFACIGLGFITIEIPMIQRYTLLLGQPIYAFAVILGCVLVASGIGSQLTSRVADERIAGASRLAIGAVVAGAVLHALLAPKLIAAGLSASLTERLALTVATIAPLGLVMGMPLPLGIRTVERRAPAAVAWAWGVNGSLSVIGTILAMTISVTAGMTWTILFGAAAYVCAWVAASSPRATAS